MMYKHRRILMMVLSMAFPWVVMFIEDRPVAGILALVLQVSVIGWAFAAIWAYGVAKESMDRQTESAQAKSV